MSKQAFQDSYPAEFSHCYGCGHDNPHGLQLKSYWLDEEDRTHTVAHFTPKPYHTGGVPDKAYGGLIASLLDCHGTASAAAAAYFKEGRKMGTAPILRFVTASLSIDFLRPTPIKEELTLYGEITQLEGRKATVALSLSANGEPCATATMIAVALKPE
ncbi:PaaI family thioesterase [Marinomonas sp. A79]|uniref:Acyl-coenzyme A thioesterase THEM4 n=1 Tax=Marinomonas vulgaris TaxID=2823372 RepID=A0ABS5H9P4_9GAMM|nr:PaaI family thioesterase [Marinomonas vulgaris]MBR7888401.1 PaaI family thioesterase [Marinomonas vulgaris]